MNGVRLGTLPETGLFVDLAAFPVLLVFIWMASYILAKARQGQVGR